MATSSGIPSSDHEPSTIASTVQKEHPVLETFPTLADPPAPSSTSRPSADINRTRGESNNSTLQGRIRSASKTFQESNPPAGMWIATGQIVSSIPTLSDIRRGSFSSDGWSGEGQTIERERRASLNRQGSSHSEEQVRKRTSSNPYSSKVLQSGETRHKSVPEAEELEQDDSGVISLAKKTSTDQLGSKTGPDRSSADSTIGKSDIKYLTTAFDNGYQFPPKHSWGESTKIFLVASWKFFITPIGFLVIVYGLNIVAWGGMLFLLLCNASPAMCNPTCNDINSPRRIWIEIDSQILNALFCVTGFGTIPWRFRDLYYLLQYRIKKNELALRRLAGINRGWFRLAGSQDLPITLGPATIEAEIAKVSESRIPFPITKISNAPLAGTRAPATALWKLDFVIWSMVWNTFLQAVLSGFMWGLNRYDRPSWSTGLFVAMASIVAGAGGILSYVETKAVKACEGVPVTDADLEKLRRDEEQGISHWNNIKDKKPKQKRSEKGQIFSIEKGRTTRR